jgi:hypothetical protein
MIPKHFELGGHRIQVKRRRKVLNDEGERVLGYFMPNQDLILLATWHEGERLSEEAIEHGFYHELAHVYMHLLNDWSFYNNEPKIDMLGMLMHQFNKSRK